MQMNLFMWLLIGHLIGDWMLQNDWMARCKRGRWWSPECISHCWVYTFSVLLTLWIGTRWTIPFSQLFTIFVFLLVSHWLIDGLNLAGWWGRLINQTKNEGVHIVVDQTMHLLVLGICVSWFLSE